MVLYINKNAFFKTYFTKESYACGVNLKNHILVDLEQYENELQPSNATFNYF